MYLLFLEDHSWPPPMQSSTAEMELCTLELNIFHLSKKHMHVVEEGPEEVCLIDIILEEQAE